jgi:hypothetical protein
MIGLDTSHTLEFTKILQSPDTPNERRITGMRAVSCLRFETPFQGTAGLDERQAVMESFGVRVTESLTEAVADCDAIMLEINDPSLHKEYFERVAMLGKPIFVDKPLAGNPQDASQILDIAQRNNLRVMSCSNLRFARAMLNAFSQLPSPPTLMNVFGMLGTPPVGKGNIPVLPVQ